LLLMRESSPCALSLVEDRECPTGGVKSGNHGVYALKQLCSAISARSASRLALTTTRNKARRTPYAHSFVTVLIIDRNGFVFVAENLGSNSGATASPCHGSNPVLCPRKPACESYVPEAAALSRRAYMNDDHSPSSSIYAPRS
jgi:hypothetical protein